MIELAMHDQLKYFISIVSFCFCFILSTNWTMNIYSVYGISYFYPSDFRKNHMEKKSLFFIKVKDQRTKITGRVWKRCILCSTFVRSGFEGLGLQPIKCWEPGSRGAGRSANQMISISSLGRIRFFQVESSVILAI